MTDLTSTNSPTEPHREPLDLAAIRAEHTDIVDDPEFHLSLHAGGLEQEAARFMDDRVPALLAEVDRLRAALDARPVPAVNAADVERELADAVVSIDAATERQMAEAASEDAAAEDVAAALALMLYDAHPTYANTSGWRGGIGGQAISQGCSVIDPPPGAEWTQYDLLGEPLRRYMSDHPFDLAAAKERVKRAALAALGLTVADEGRAEA